MADIHQARRHRGTHASEPGNSDLHAFPPLVPCITNNTTITRLGESMSASSKTVGIVGLGIMGGAISKNLSSAGWQVIGFDLDQARCAEAKAAGVEIVDSAVAVAQKAERILVSLPKPEALMTTVNALGAAKLPRRIIAELSTFALDDKAEAEIALRTADHVMLDCPLSGTGSQARTKDLIVY